MNAQGADTMNRTTPPVAGSEAPAVAGARLYYLDWIRVAVIAGVYVTHAMIVFSGLPWLINSSQTLFLVVTPLLAVANQIGMPLLFMVSGAATWFSLRKRTSKQFIGERFSRLVIPYLVFAVLLSPIQAYYEALDKGTYQGPFLAYLPQFFNLSRFTAFDLTWAGGYGYHLWFLIFLFFYSVVSLPLFGYARSGRGQWLPRFLTRICRSPGGVLLLVVPIALSQVILRIPFASYQGWADTFFWGFFYVYGYLFISQKGLDEMIGGHWKAGLVGFIGSLAGLTALGGFTLIGLGQVFTLEGAAALAPGLILGELAVAAILIYVAVFSLISLNSWSAVITVLSAMKRKANQDSPALQYLGEIAMPFYLIHHPVIVVFGYYIVRLNIGAWPELLLLGVSAAVITWGIIELYIRRIGFLRRMLGMKPKPSGVTFRIRRAAPLQIGFAVIVIAFGLVLSALAG